jgi:hypothetical protein
MKTAQEKAHELINEFYSLDCVISDFDGGGGFTDAKEMALICVNQIIENCPFKDYGFKFDSISSRLDAIENYWKQVKEEIVMFKP